MRSSLIVLLAASGLVACPGASSQAQGPSAPAPDHAAASLRAYESTGLSILKPYEKGKIPVVLVHGLWASPWSWDRMIRTLESDPAIDGAFQFWTYGYSTGDPLPYSASKLRAVLDQARGQFDPDRSDPAFSRLVLVGHSMGGLMSWMQITASDRALWRGVTDRSFEELRGRQDDVEMTRQCFFFEPRTEIARAVLIATPHLGSRIDHGSIRQLGSRLVRLPDPLTSCHRRLLAANPPDFFKGRFSTHVPTSVDELAWRDPMITAVASLKPRAGVRIHSIIPTLSGQAGPHETDGVVPYESAHLEKAESETVLKAGHLCQDHPRVAEEVRRILMEHVADRS
ncbi:esterase/lipase family protein [Paludisphaera mucosa]|uniref:Alpha/beta hydrolase n=1 Tax=Paludisphaera mucosa TaxID=3030827 RepID=A0ABT6FDK1_9BACT|nr:alpha/beta hydrolase [Paludisphaera mucosa]MDG3005612.1 alpha/beta hydrolase [Paludisphaera mucosa]